MPKCYIDVPHEIPGWVRVYRLTDPVYCHVEAVTLARTYDHRLKVGWGTPSPETQARASQAILRHFANKD